MLRGIYGDMDRYVKQQSRWTEDVYFTGDGAKRDDAGYLWLLGRVDDVLNVAGHRIGTMEGKRGGRSPHGRRVRRRGTDARHQGQAVAAFVTVKEG
jgi:acetyl-CoA synthetase